MFVATALAMSFAIAAGRNERLGVILLHGKLGDPLERRTGLDALALNLHAAGHMIALPSMPWSDQGWLTIDRDVPASLGLIDRLATQMRAQGAGRIVLVGHSLGADVALAYAVSRRNVAGLVMTAPGHTPAALAERDAATRSALERARAMVANGRGDDRFLGPDRAEDTSLTLNTRAGVYLSWMDPQGLAEMSVQAPRLPASIPLLMVVGEKDPIAGRAEGMLYKPAAKNPYSKYATNGASHVETP
ncbi:MAG TPA: alpha/beta hydrolase, partial [Reyranella sp.]|nr:alpha/beta hydrolase [Reyranella sp.]